MDSALYPVRRLKNVVLLLLTASFAFACFKVAPEFHRPGKIYFAAAIFALCVPFVLWELATVTDLAFDPRGIRYKHRLVRWSDVRAIRVHSHTTTSHRGFIPDYAERNGRIADVEVVETRTSVAVPQLVVIPIDQQQEDIVVEASGGNLKIRGRSIALPPGGLLEIAQRMIELQRAVLGEKGVLHARLGMAQERDATPEPPPPPPPAPRGFGRKGLA